MDQAADALIGAGYGAAGERCMAISVAVPVGDDTADRLIEKLVPRIEKLKVGPTPLAMTWITALLSLPPQKPTSNVWFKPVSIKVLSWLLMVAISHLQGYEEGFFVGPHLFDRATKDMDIYKHEIFGPS